jgi:SAM-dependent methyltransferase
VRTTSHTPLLGRPVVESHPIVRIGLAENVMVGTRDAHAAFVWDLSRRLVDGLSLGRGQHVLDARCGAGAASIAAATRVGRDGLVLGLDLSPPLVASARSLASLLVLPQTHFQIGDFETSTAPATGFNAVMCAFGMAQVHDPVEALRMLWLQVRPGGELAIAVFARGLLGPAVATLLNSLMLAHPDVAAACQRCTDFGTERALTKLLETSGVHAFRVSTHVYQQTLRTPKDWWSIVCMVYGEPLSALAAGDLERLRDDQIRAIEEAQIHSLRTDALFAFARKPTTQ